MSQSIGCCRSILGRVEAMASTYFCVPPVLKITTRSSGLIQPCCESVSIAPTQAAVSGQTETPSRDIASLANEFEPRLPWTFRFLTRRWGTRRSRSQELLSTILFQGDYIRRLLEVGEEDGARHAGAVAELLAD